MRSLDIIIPVYNEEEALPLLLDRLHRVFSPSALEERRLSSVHFMFVDDGSHDGTASILTAALAQGLPATVICLSRNFGHQPAVAAGLDQSTAEFVGVIDADLQDPPELLLAMVHRLDEGFDIVFGQRRTRRESFSKRFLYSSFYRLCSFLSEVQMPVDAGDFGVMRRSVVMALRELPEKLRFHRGLRSWIGFRQSAFPYDRPSRELGESKYSWSMLYKLATDGIASLSIRPLQITQAFLFLSVLVTLAFVCATSYAYLKSHETDSHLLWFLSTQGLIAFTSSLQLFSLYILGAYIGRMYLEVKARPSYVISKTVQSSSVVMK